MKNWIELYNNNEISLDIELTTYCNAKCPICARTNHRDRLKPMIDAMPLRHMSLDMFKHIIGDFKGLSHIHFSGTYGDPGMHPDLDKVVEHIIDNSECTISICTNGSMREEMFWYKLGMIGHERLNIIFDVDGPTQEIHEQYRVGTKLDKVLENMKAVSETPATVRGFSVIFKHNQDYIKDIEQLCYDHGADSYYFVESNRFKTDKYHYQDVDGNWKYYEQTNLNHEYEIRVRDYRHYNIEDNTSVKCFSIDRRKLKISVDTMVEPCCWLGPKLDRIHRGVWKRSDYDLTPTENYFLDNIEMFQLKYYTLEEIINNTWYAYILPKSWNVMNEAPWQCKWMCGKC